MISPDCNGILFCLAKAGQAEPEWKTKKDTVESGIKLLKKISGKLVSLKILRNKKPEISTTPGFGISLYCCPKNVPNHEALPP